MVRNEDRASEQWNLNEKEKPHAYIPNELQINLLFSFSSGEVVTHRMKHTFFFIQALMNRYRPISSEHSFRGHSKTKYCQDYNADNVFHLIKSHKTLSCGFSSCDDMTLPEHEDSISLNSFSIVISVLFLSPS